MTEEQVRKAQAQQREFPETMEIMSRLRDSLAAQLFKTKLNEKDAREDIYLRVQTLDAMMAEMESKLATYASETAMNAYAEELATSGK